ncbi:pilus assembly protein PilP [Polyangium jinanense]|uniref:Pilus assembly protein PilP n=1 Tax=Polyangium jinanense TaxID=2829994 RepID=A0A9X4ATK7_9BACT|nr:pilus assembly protein PilP [Polyangium jinanense]MDC3955670.1 pilus assembly protein PilP [Polyangium jinanense]MDC3982312.1 pilus assembly protein PilP [Polyangium jinanense]
MKRARSLFWLLFAALVLIVFASGCEEDELWVPPPSATPSPGAAPDGGVGTDGGPQTAAKKDQPELPQREFVEADFTETEKNRDPFRGFASVFAQQAKGRAVVQRTVVIERYALDELKLSGLVTRSQPRALFIDPANVGWVVKVGDYVGKPEIVRTGGPAGIDVAINWRVDRIREGDVVFVREDPAHPEIAPVTRVIALFPEENAGNEARR